MKDLDIINFPLHGIRLIEASAGTGKTYAITIIYLRLLLHLGENQSAFSRPLTVKEILVVTFTKSAKQNLQYQIKKNIHQFRLDCIQGYSNNSLFTKLLSQIHNINLAIDRLTDAEKIINQKTAIFTIHEFCHKVLMHNTIELNMLFNITITNQEILLYQQACFDFWRKHFYPLAINIITLVQEYWTTPDALLQDILPHIHNNFSKIHSSIFRYKKHEDIIEHYTKIINHIKQIKKQWTNQQNNFYKIEDYYYTNRKIYNKKNLTNWYNIINQWAMQSTTNHIVPAVLQYFKLSSFLKTNNNSYILFKKTTFNHISSLFNKIEELYQYLSLFKTLIFSVAINYIHQYLNNTRHSRTEITFNDLINLLLDKLINDKKNKNTFSDTIRMQYPIAIIDEFQDTDQQQYKIFHILYDDCHTKYGLILIGDPKQAIYSFRGADILTYMQVRKSVPNKYNLSINWRSSTSMVNAINQLFQFTTNPFIFQDIPFIPLTTPSKNKTYKYLIHGKPQQAMCFWLSPEPIITISEYKKNMAQECGIVIHNLLRAISNKQAWLEHEDNKRIVQPADITILVRTHEEASLIQSELLKLNISTIFLSNQNNIFKTAESYELLLLLQSVLFPGRNTIGAALTTTFFKLSIDDIAKINNNESKWEKILEEFTQYHSIWKKKGIFPMIQTIIFQYKIPEILLSTPTGKISLINILHLGELLQNVAQQLKYEQNLIQWLFLQTTQTQIGHIPTDHYLRMDNNLQLIKISTIHKAKGLEFPITFLPFMANFKYKKNIDNQTKKNKIKKLNYNESFHNISSCEIQLSEELRLLYVALTRSIYHCSIGIGPIIHHCQYNKKYTDTDINELNYSALGYLIQQNRPGNSILLKKNLQALNTLANDDITFRNTTKQEKLVPITKKKFTIHQSLSVKQWNPSNLQNNLWYITSYSTLKNNNNKSNHLNLYNKLCNINENTIFQKKDIILNPHTFPKGKVCGLFLHSVFETLNFQNTIDIQWLRIQMKKYDIDPIWENMIQNWIHNIINTPLSQNINLTLNKIKSKNKKTEFNFYLPIKINITSQKLNDLCKYYDLLSYKSSSLTFADIKGMLQGFIDLVFRWNHQYFLLDYKTNWLGENNEAYLRLNIEEEMIKNHYALQYQLYTLALHRFLQNRILKYNYEKHFGGIYYLFIRGMDGTQYSKGIYFSRLPLTFVEKLDFLFSGQ